MREKLLLSLALLVVAVASPQALADSHNVYGTFFTQVKNSHVKISDCGDGSPCGVVVWLNPQSLPEGVTPESAKTKIGEPVLGLTMLQGFERRNKDWRGGTIYDPGKDKTYASRLQRLDNGNLEVKGCITVFCQTQVWTEVPE